MFFQKNILLKAGCMTAAVAVLHMASADSQSQEMKFYGLADMRSGQFVNYKFGARGHELSHQWIQNNMVILGVRTKFHSRLEGGIGLLGWIAYHNFPDSMLMDQARIAKGTDVLFKFDRAEMTLNCSPDPLDSLLKVHIGLFPYKYNSDVRNLGEYLFRTGCYPGYIMSDGFDMPLAQIAGIRLTNDIFNGWHNELLLTTELYIYPMNDFSLTYLTDVSLLNRAFNVGAAVQLFHCLPVNNDYTQPENYQCLPIAPSSPKAPNYYFSEDDPMHTDTLFYTFSGTKIMGRVSFDPKPFLGGIDMFGPEDLKLYSEAIILGVKNYPANPDSADWTAGWNQRPINEFGYDKLIQKMPIMVGFNFPAFKLLDVFSVEVEYYGKKYVNRVPVAAQGLGMMRLPVPYDNQIYAGLPAGDSTTGGSGQYSKSTYFSGAAQWKWSVYIRKSLFNNFSITAQAARDHSRVQTTLASSLDLEEALIKSNQWCWMLKFGYSF